MTISLVPEDSRRRRFVCTGGETSFAITFPVFAASDVQVIRFRGQATTTLAQPADYVVVGAGNPAGFTVTLTAAAQAGDVIVVLSAQPVSRTSEWTDGQALRAQALNAEFARWWIALQQSKRDLDRTIRLATTDESLAGELPPAAERAGRLFGFDPVTGAPVAVTPNPGNLVISAQGEALIAAATPSAARGVIDAASSADVAARVAKAGDTMTGALTLPGAPTAANHAATKAYVDGETAARVAKTGDTMTGFLTLHADPTAAMHAVTKQYVDRGTAGPVNASGSAVDFTGIPSWATQVRVIGAGIVTTDASIRLRVGATTILTTGYTCSASNAASGIISSSSTASFIMAGQEMPATFHFIMQLIKHPSLDFWLFQANGSYSSPGTLRGTGWIDIGATLQQIRVFVPSGTFSAGLVWVEWRR